MNLFAEIEKNFSKIEKFLENENLKEFMECAYTDLFLYHFGLGTWIRNNLLKEENVLYNMFVAVGIFHKDDMSELIIRLFYIHIHMSYKAVDKMKF